MNKIEGRIDGIIHQIREMKSSIDQLKSERDELKSKITQLEKENTELKSNSSSGHNMEAEGLKAEIDKQVEALDECLDMLKTI